VPCPTDGDSRVRLALVAPCSESVASVNVPCRLDRVHILVRPSKSTVQRSLVIYNRNRKNYSILVRSNSLDPNYCPSERRSGRRGSRKVIQRGVPAENAAHHDAGRVGCDVRGRCAMALAMPLPCVFARQEGVRPHHRIVSPGAVWTRSADSRTRARLPVQRIYAAAHAPERQRFANYKLMKHRQFTKVNADDSDVTDVDSDEEVLRRPQRCASGHGAPLNCVRQCPRSCAECTACFDCVCVLSAERARVCCTSACVHTGRAGEPAARRTGPPRPRRVKHAIR